MTKRSMKIPNVEIPGNDAIKKLPGITLPVATEFKRGDEDFSSHFKFYTAYPWLKCVKVDEFTNYCKDDDELKSSIIFWIHEMIPKIYLHSEDIFSKNKMRDTPLFHSHKVDDKKRNQVVKIAEKITGEEFDPNLTWWQLGGIQGGRLFGVYRSAEPAFYPIFIDRHHLIYASIKHNQADYLKYNTGL